MDVVEPKPEKPVDGVVVAVEPKPKGLAAVVCAVCPKRPVEGVEVVLVVVVVLVVPKPKGRLVVWLEENKFPLPNAVPELVPVVVVEEKRPLPPNCDVCCCGNLRFA